jgi:hypothetical protein
MTDFAAVKDNGKKVRLEWESIADHGTHQNVYESKDRPAAEFSDALANFANPVRAALGLPSDYEVEVRKVTVEKITKGDNEGDIAGVQVHVIFPVEGTNRVCNAHPFVAASEFEDLVDLIETLEQEAEDYLTRKKRAQRELGDTDEKPEGALTDEQRERAGTDWQDENAEEMQPA